MISCCNDWTDPRPGLEDRAPSRDILVLTCGGLPRTAHPALIATTTRLVRRGFKIEQVVEAST